MGSPFFVCLSERGERMYLLNELWYGNVHPNERFVRSDSQYAKVSKEATDIYDHLMKLLPKEEKALLDEFCKKSMTASSIAEEDAFICGVRIGARFILDITGEYHSQIPQIGET